MPAHRLDRPQPTVALIAGTRPEAVKIATLPPAMADRGLRPVIVDTGQQPGRVLEALTPFGQRPQASLSIARDSGELNELVGRVAVAVDEHLRDARPAAVLVQGDTTTAMTAALAAHMRRIPVIHLEAGLRTGDPDEPFPEETNRRLIGSLAALNLAPTRCAREALAREGVRDDRIVVTGNTVVDALGVLLPRARGAARRRSDGRTLVVTVHRREAWGEGVRAVAESVRRLLARHDDLHAIVVTHPNPVVAGDVRHVLSGTPRCTLLPPQPYDEMLALLCGADVVLTDSGGIQEEAPSIGVPVVVTRRVTERPEGVEAGLADLVGLEEDAIVEAVTHRLDGPGLAADTANPYGDGHASARVAQAVAWLLGRAARPDDWAGTPAPRA